MKKVIVIAGVTATGKTSLGVKLAQQFNGEIINADSVSIYQDLNIGSAKASLEERGGIKHHLLDKLKIKDDYSVAEFQKDARKAIEDIVKRGKTPIIVGGTGLYINAVIYDYHFKNQDLVHINQDLSNEELKSILDKSDPESSKQIHVNNRKRLIRAVQIVKTYGKPRSEVNKARKNKMVYDAKIYFLQGEREKLYSRINNRVEEMFKQGLLKEVEDLYQTNPDLFEFRSTRAIGYQEFKEYFPGNINILKVEELIKRNTRRLAKRQITWFKHQTESKWLDIFENPVYKTIKEELEIFLKP